MKIREYKPSHFQIHGYYKGERFFIQKDDSGNPLTSLSQATQVKVGIEYMIDLNQFDPKTWGKPKVNPYSFSVAIEDWLQKKKDTISVYTHYNLSRIVKKYLVPFFKDKDYTTINDQDIDNLHHSIIGKSAKRTRDILDCLRTFLRSKKITLTFPKIKQPEKPIQWITSKEQDKVFKHIPKEDVAIFTFLRYTGCRPSEGCGLLTQNVDFTKNQVTISTSLARNRTLQSTTKTKMARVLPIIPQIKKCLKGNGKFVFEKNGKPYTTQMLERAWKKANAKSVVKPINLYNALKHSFAMQRLQSGYSLEKLQAVFGHTTSDMTRRYAKYLPNQLADILSNRSPKNNPPFTPPNTGNHRKKKVDVKESGCCSNTKTCPYFNKLQTLYSEIHHWFTIEGGNPSPENKS